MAIKYIRDIDIYHYYEVHTIDSTNTYFKNNYANYPTHSVLLAYNQTGGRGRFDRKWTSNDDICFSILFKNKFNNSLIAPLSIVLALEKYDVHTAIKWPNDIYLNNQKLAGILIEDIYEDTLKASIVGIGINIYNKPEFNGIGLNGYYNNDKETLLKDILFFYKKLASRKELEILELYKKYSIVLGNEISYKEKNYKALDITKEGYLLVTNGTNKFTIKSNEIGFKYMKK